MGVETMIATAAIGSVIGGGMSLMASNKQAKAMEQQGDLALVEGIRDAGLIEQQGRQFVANQKMKYIMSGVSIVGSPMLVLDDTAEKVKQEIAATKTRALAQRILAYDNAEVTANEGRAKFLSSLVSAGTSGFSLYSSAKSAGLFGNTAPADAVATP